jgi:hypothetical protein
MAVPGRPSVGDTPRRPQRVAAEMEPKQPVPESDLVLELGFLDGLTARVAQIALAATTPGLDKLVPGQVVSDELAPECDRRDRDLCSCGSPR